MKFMTKNLLAALLVLAAYGNCAAMDVAGGDAASVTSASEVEQNIAAQALLAENKQAVLNQIKSLLKFIKTTGADDKFNLRIQELARELATAANNEAVDGISGQLPQIRNLIHKETRPNKL